MNPINGFHVAHEMAKVGGVIRHSFPLIGWREHGFFYSTTKFCAHLVGDNGYELLTASAIMTASEPFDDPFFTYVIDESLEEVVQRPPVTNIWAELVYRKRDDRPFVIPVDHVGGPDASKGRRKLVEHHQQLASRRLIS